MNHKFTLMLLCLLLCTCTTLPVPPPSPGGSGHDPFDHPVPPAPPAQLHGAGLPPSSFGGFLSNISTSTIVFDPSQRENVAIHYTLLRKAAVRLDIFDPDFGLIRTIDSGKVIPSGNHDFHWDGKDLDGTLVPNEAYFFTLSAEDEKGQKGVYDPTLFSGGVAGDIISARIDPQTYDIHFTLPESGRIMIRIGIQGGPLMNQLVDWEPRPKGPITEYWDGRDADHLINLYEHPDFKMIITYFSLPQNSIIVYGGKELNFRRYKGALAKRRPQKVKLRRNRLSPSSHYDLLRTVDYSPKVTLEFANSKGKDQNGFPVLHEKSVVKVALAENDRAVFQNSQFEICFYLDHQFYAEDESGYIPFSWVWHLDDVSAGVHLFTVNIASFQDQIGVVSQMVKVVK